MEEQIHLKNKRKSMIASDTPANSSESLGLKVSRSLKAKLSKVAKLGKCQSCGRIIVRFSKEINVAVCTCKSVVEVSLTVTINRDRYEFGKRLAKEMSLEGSGTYDHLLQGLLNDVFEIETEEIV